MRRSMHSLIVALLCLTLFVDSAKACWWLRQHRSRAQVCRPVRCRTVAPPCCTVEGEFVVVGPAVAADGETIFADDQAGCACGEAAVGHTAVDRDHSVAPGHDSVEHAIEHAPVEQQVSEQAPREPAVAAPAEAGDASVVVHGPTIVVDAAPKQLAGAAEPKAVAAQPMPVAAASPTVLPKPTAAEEPIPDLKPAVASQSPVEPASNEQPSPEPQATTESPVPAAAALAPTPAATDAAATPMPAPVDDLAGGPEQKAVPTRPLEPNLFDLYGDAGDDDVAPSQEAPVEDPAADALEPQTEATATDEPVMTETEPSADGGAEQTDEQPAEKPVQEPAPASAEESVDATDGDDASEESEQPPEDEPVEEEADPAAAAFATPDEPMRRWSDDTGTHHARGWLVEVRADRVRILKVNGRHTTVARESLSTADQEYVSAVGERLAAERQGTSPAPTATAGL